MTSKHYGDQLIDAHLHLDDREHTTAVGAVATLLSQMDTAGVDHAVVLHLKWQRWSMAEVAEALVHQPRLTGFVNIDPVSGRQPSDLAEASAMGFRGLKLHPRLQRYRPDDPRCIELVQQAGALGWPTVLDCFPDGEWLLAGLDVRQYAILAREAPASRVIVAHAAGHHCLDLLMLAKRVPNLWFDLSYSWLYYEPGVIADIAYCIRSMRGERVLFGTDYPDRGLPESIQRSLERLAEHGVDADLQRKILWQNAYRLLQTHSV